MRYIEEPYEGNLQVRFCEGHYAPPNYKLNKRRGRNVCSARKNFNNRR